VIRDAVFSDLRATGPLIYSLENPSLSLPPPASVSDRVLRFNSRFESGNLDRAYHLAPDAYHLFLEPDANKGGSCQWFYFEASNVRRDTRYTFAISGFHKAHGAFANGGKVFWYSDRQAREAGVSWARGGTNYEVGICESIPGFSLRFQMQFPHDLDVVYLAYGLPYTYADLLEHLRAWKAGAADLVTVSTLCRSFNGHACPLVTIGRRPFTDKPVVFLTARCHPGESNGSVVLHGFIDCLLSDCPASRDLLANFVFRIVPMVCIDGVIAGHYRVCACGSDLNRTWADPDEDLHPIVHATKELLKADPPRLYIDFHGHSKMNGTFAYGCPADGRERVFPKLISLLCDGFAFSNCTFSIPQNRKGASRCVVREELGVVESFCIETSFCGISGGRLAQVLYDEWLWKEIGCKICHAARHLLTRQASKLREFAENELRSGLGWEREKAPPMRSRQALISRPVWGQQKKPAERSRVWKSFRQDCPVKKFVLL
jgi:hypothetical protein